MRFGIIGTGTISSWFIELGSQCEAFEAVAVLSRTRSQGETFANQHHIPSVFTDIGCMAADEMIEAVYIASPNVCHMEQTITMLNAGKHVLCEKPIASNSDELIRMIHSAKSNRCVFMEAMRTSFNPTLMELKQQVARLGTPKEVVLVFGRRSSRYDLYRKGKDINTFNPKYSNSALMDMGVYCVALMLELFGEPIDINAKGVKLKNGFMGSGEIKAHYPGFEVTLLFSKVEDMPKKGRIQFDDASILIDDCAGLNGITVRDATQSIIIPDAAPPDMYHEVCTFINACKNDRGIMERHNGRSIATMRILDDAHRQCGIVFPVDDR